MWTRRLCVDTIQSLLDISETYGDIARMRIGPITLHIVRDPIAIQTVLHKRYEHFDKGTPTYMAGRDLLGNWLLTSEGPLWRRQRRMAQPAFHPHRIAAYADAMVEETQHTLTQWEAHGDEPLDITTAMTSLTLRIVARTLFDVRLSAADILSVSEVLDIMQYRLRSAPARWRSIHSTGSYPGVASDTSSGPSLY